MERSGTGFKNGSMADAYTLALTLLSARELSETQLRARLARRQCDAEAIDDAVSRLKEMARSNDRRVALAWRGWRARSSTAAAHA
jgi:SOS response regulatory protein OraA/RecX